jgi:transposase
LREGHEIYFMDAVHTEFQSQAVCGWIKKGETKTLPTTNRQYQLHFIGAIALKNMEVIAQEYKTVKAENMIKFLKHLEACSSASKIHYLPAYSPNLNPIERLWKIMREFNTYNRCYDKFEDFSTAICKFFFEDIPKIVGVLEKRINDKFQRIVLNSVVIAAA